MFFSPFSITITSLGEERANLSAFRTFVRFVLVWICRFSLPPGFWEGLRFVIVALPGLLSYPFLFYIYPLEVISSGLAFTNYLSYEAFTFFITHQIIIIKTKIDAAGLTALIVQLLLCCLVSILTILKALVSRRKLCISIPFIPNK